MDGTNLNAKQLEALISKQDALIPSPSKRAEVIYALLRKQYGDDITTWDMVCGCIEILGTLLPLYPWLESPVKHASRNIYYAHYFTDIENVERSIANNARVIESLSGDGTESDSVGLNEKGGES